MAGRGSRKKATPKAAAQSGGLQHRTLLRKRSNILGSANLIQDFLTNFRDDQVTQIPLRNQRLDDLWERFEDVQDEIEVIEGAEDDYSQQRQQFHDQYFVLKAALADKIPEPAVVVPAPAPLAHHAAGNQISVKLPEIKLPDFFGEYEEWTEFRDIFKSLIHANMQLTAIQKLHYLRSSCKGHASRHIAGLELNADNYEIAWNILWDRYENKTYLVKQHLSAMFRIPSLRKESAANLSDLADEFNRHVGILDKLESADAHWNSLLVERLSSLLDEKSRMEWESECKDKVAPTYQELLDFIHKRSRLLRLCKPNLESSSSQSKPTKAKQSSSHVASEHVLKCVQCKQAHQLIECEAFLQLSPKQRLELAKKKRLCINCLKGGHMAKECKRGNCRTCAKKHHTLLHLPPLKPAAAEDDPATSQSCTAVCSPPVATQATISRAVSLALPSVQSRTSSQTLASFSNSVVSPSPVLTDRIGSEPLQIAPQVAPPFSAQASKPADTTVFLATAVIRVLDVHGRYQQARALLDSGSQSNFVSESLCQKLGLKRRRINLPICGIGQATVNVHYSVQLAFASRFAKYERELTCLVLPKLTVCLPSRHGVDLIIGAELFFDLLESNQILLADDLPLLQKTQLGYVISGKCSSLSTAPLVCHLATEEDLNAKLERLWEVENFDVGKVLTPEQQLVEDHFKRTVSRSNDGRYMVRLPLREELVSLIPNSYATAERRFLAMEKRLSADEHLKEEYQRFMDDYERLGHKEKCSRVAGPQFFLPHHAIQRPGSSTTKTRVVFDGSAKGSGRFSLNSILHTGPTVQPPLLSTILNFRLPKFAFTADAEKMFRQVWVHPEDRKWQQIIWRKNPTETLQIYQLKMVTYGLASSPFHAARVLNQLAEDEGHRYPIGAQIVGKRFYVDDVLAGADTLEDADEACHQVRELFQLAGFSLRKWSASHPDILQRIPQDLWESSPTKEIGEPDFAKALGLLWDPRADCFRFKIPTFPELAVTTKRIVVSEMAQLFDPAGWMGPVLMSVKIFVQHLWATNKGWDDPLSPEDDRWWKDFRREIPMLQQVEVPRRVIGNTTRNYKLHFPCCGQTVPRLELCAARLGAELVNLLLETTDFVGPVTFWSDSTVVLHWLRSPPVTWKVFVSNRIAEIQRLTKDDTWRHVPTEMNPADLISRGLRPSQLLDQPLWWYGCSFFTNLNEPWPPVMPTLSLAALAEMDLERRQSVALVATGPDESIFERQSELGKLLKLVAWCNRFCQNARRPEEERLSGKLKPSEVALKLLVRAAQRTSFPKEIQEYEKHGNQGTSSVPREPKSPLKNLNLFLDPQGILRIHSRLSNRDVAYDSKYPMLLPAKHKLSTLIARSLHLQTAHSGPSALLATIRQRFWPLRGRDLVRREVKSCITCFRCRPPVPQQQMAPLPAVRTTPTRVFANSGLDYCGPFLVRPLYGRGANVKMYVAVFVCLSVKAVHLEVVPDLTTTACINGIKRFVGRRGRLIELRCDNATAFVGADRELKELRKRYLEQFRTAEWENYCLDSGITFRFIPPRSPHFGGLWEAGVKSFKHHFRRIFGGRSCTVDELTTAVVHIESILNSRPLTPLTDHPDDLAILTPGHFLIGEPMFSIPEPDYTSAPLNRITRLQETRRSVQDFWKVWSRDYISQLHQRSKWRTATKNVQEEPWCCSNGLVRVVLVRTAHGEYKRAVTEVRVLPIDQPADDVEDKAVPEAAENEEGDKQADPDAAENDDEGVQAVPETAG
ncbi:uncharacterized protein LOC119766322 [Culex quinquefasciatus]|uniref:uncharacterized protein LOC119766322 n=1 Tax=Culex quinquefasciatus TaxID=7176 RepID=UPI0018E3A924|nr:uncharacterized protein LOC119766322 [Culex quinquefasciatus]